MPIPVLQNYILTDGTFSSEACLMHHGIKGMKWGIRRFQNPDGTLTTEGKTRRSNSEQTAAPKRHGIFRTGRVERIHTMSDDELLARIGRLEKEKQMLQLEDTIRDYGRTTANKVMRTAGKTAAVTFATAGAIYGGKKTIAFAADILGKDGSKLIHDLFPKKK